MSALRLLQRFLVPGLATVVLACFSNAGAQTSYKVQDLGALNNGVFGCAMGLNNRGWYLDSSGDFVGRAVVSVSGLKIDLGTLGGVTVGSIGEELMNKGRRWALPKRPCQIQTAKTSAVSAPGSPVARFCGKTVK